MFSFEKLRTFVVRYERHLSAGALAGGFVIDTLTFQRINVPLSHAVLFIYLGTAPALVGGKNTSSLTDGESLHTPEELFNIKSLELVQAKPLESSYLLLGYEVNN